MHSKDETRSVEDPVTSKISLKQAFEVNGRVDAQRQLQSCDYTAVALPEDSHECPPKNECGSFLRDSKLIKEMLYNIIE